MKNVWFSIVVSLINSGIILFFLKKIWPGDKSKAKWESIRYDNEQIIDLRNKYRVDKDEVLSQLVAKIGRKITIEDVKQILFSKYRITIFRDLKRHYRYIYLKNNQYVPRYNIAIAIIMFVVLAFPLTYYFYTMDSFIFTPDEPWPIEAIIFSSILGIIGLILYIKYLNAHSFCYLVRNDDTDKTIPS